MKGRIFVTQHQIYNKMQVFDGLSHFEKKHQNLRPKIGTVYWHWSVKRYKFPNSVDTSQRNINAILGQLAVPYFINSKQFPTLNIK